MAWIPRGLQFVPKMALAWNGLKDIVRKSYPIATPDACPVLSRFENGESVTTTNDDYFVAALVMHGCIALLDETTTTKDVVVSIGEQTYAIAVYRIE